MSQIYCLSTYLALYIVTSASCWVGLSLVNQVKNQKEKKKITTKKLQSSNLKKKKANNRSG